MQEAKYQAALKPARFYDRFLYQYRRSQTQANLQAASNTVGTRMQLQESRISLAGSGIMVACYTLRESFMGQNLVGRQLEAVATEQ